MTKQNCKKCGKRIINPKSQWQQYCENCQIEDVTSSNKIKMEDKMPTSKKVDSKKVKEVKTPKVSKEPKEKKPSITNERVAHAEAVLKLLNERNVPKEAQCAVLSRAYNLAKVK